MKKKSDYLPPGGCYKSIFFEDHEKNAQELTQILGVDVSIHVVKKIEQVVNDYSIMGEKIIIHSPKDKKDEIQSVIRSCNAYLRHIKDLQTREKLIKVLGAMSNTEASELMGWTYNKIFRLIEVALEKPSRNNVEEIKAEAQKIKDTLQTDKGGRPPNRMGLRMLIQKAACIYEDATGKRPTVTRDPYDENETYKGKFVEFVDCIFYFIEVAILKKSAWDCFGQYKKLCNRLWVYYKNNQHNQCYWCDKFEKERLESRIEEKSAQKERCRNQLISNKTLGPIVQYVLYAYKSPSRKLFPIK